MVEERERLGAMGNALLLSQGFGSWSNLWRPKAWAQLSSLVPQWLLERFKIWVDVLKMLDEKIYRLKWLWLGPAAGHGLKGLGPSVRCNSKARYSIGRFIPTVARSLAWPGWSLANGVPETQNGVAPLPKWECRLYRRIIVEMVWRMILFQPQYKPVQKWRKVLRGPNLALKKKAVIAIGRQLKRRDAQNASKNRIGRPSRCRWSQTGFRDRDKPGTRGICSQGPASRGRENRQCCKFVVEAEVCVDDR